MHLDVTNLDIHQVCITHLGRVHSATEAVNLKTEEFDNATITSHFGYLFEDNSGREMSGLS